MSKKTKRLLDLCNSLGLVTFGGSDEQMNAEIFHVMACDLMSDVLTVDHDGFLLITSLASDQVARTADIVGAAGIVLVNGKNPQPALQTLAGQLGIPLLGTDLPCYEFCLALGRVYSEPRQAET